MKLGENDVEIVYEVIFRQLKPVRVIYAYQTHMYQTMCISSSPLVEKS